MPRDSGSDDLKRFCQAHNPEPSMSRRANCWDNAVAESFFSSLKKERIRKRIYKTRDLARTISSNILRCFITELAARAFWAESVPRRMKAPRREAGICPPIRQSPIKELQHIRPFSASPKPE